MERDMLITKAAIKKEIKYKDVISIRFMHGTV